MAFLLPFLFGSSHFNMRILIIDDHPLALQGIQFCLNSADFSVTTAASLEKAVLALQQPFDVLLLDYHLNEHNALELLNDTSITLPSLVLLISGMSDPEDVTHCLSFPSVTGFFSKQSDLSDLVPAIHLLPELDCSFPWVWSSIHHNFTSLDQAFPEHTFLTPKERCVFMLLRKGLLDKEIAESLSRSIHTIRVQIRSIKRKRTVIRRSV